jgi:hypothetical protein
MTDHEGLDAENRYDSTLSFSSMLGGRSMPCSMCCNSKKDLVSREQEVRWVSGPVWTGAEYLTPIEIRSPNHPAHSQLLY